jgi:diguanylate cyclase (GGDEF)-like protein
MRELRSLLAAAAFSLTAAVAIAAPSDDAAVRRELEAHRTATTFDDADSHQEAAVKLLGPGVAPAVREQVESIECQELSYEAEDPDGQLWRAAQAGVVQALATGDAATEARYHLCAGNILMARGEYDHAAARYEQALAKARKARSISVEAIALNLRGSLESARGAFRDALVDLNRAHDLFQAAGEPANLIGVSNELAKLYSRLGDNATALAYFQSVYTAVAATANDSDTSIILGNLATANDALGRQADAQAQISESLKRAELAKDPLQIAVVRMKQGRILDHAKQFGPALAALTLARKHFLEQGDKERLALTDLYLAQALEPLGQPAQALDHVQAARAAFEANQSLLNLAEAQTLEARLLSTLGRDHQAYVAEQAARATSMRLAKQANDYQMILAQAASATREQRAENARLRQQIQAQREVIGERDRTRRWQRAALAAGLVVLLGIAALAWRQFRRAQRMRHLSLTDELTGLPNRRNIFAFGGDALEHARRMGDEFSLVLLDIDHFKLINDHYGHDGGDAVLRAVAACLPVGLRHGCRVGRTGGEEFLAVLPHAGIEHAIAAAERLRSQVAGLALERDGKPLTVTISLGVVTVPPASGDLESLCAKADKAMYAAKQKGRNCVVHYRELSVQPEFLPA